MAFYDHIARKWHSVTGSRGGAFKKWVLNDLLISKIHGIAGMSILELGAGNGYFFPLVIQKFSGQVPVRLVISDQSAVLMDLAQRYFRVANAEYLVLNVCHPFPFPEKSFDLILANMIFNEINTPCLQRALRECHRVLCSGGRLLATVTHPAFVDSLKRRGQLKPLKGKVCTMPGAEGLRLPVVPRSSEKYFAALEEAGFRTCSEAVSPTVQVFKAKPGLRLAGDVPVALLLEGEK